MDIPNLILNGIIIGLSILFAVSCTLFMQRKLINSSAKRMHSADINQKLNRIIELLESNKSV